MMESTSCYKHAYIYKYNITEYQLFCLATLIPKALVNVTLRARTEFKCRVTSNGVYPVTNKQTRLNIDIFCARLCTFSRILTVSGYVRQARRCVTEMLQNIILVTYVLKSLDRSNNTNKKRVEQAGGHNHHVHAIKQRYLPVGVVKRHPSSCYDSEAKRLCSIDLSSPFYTCLSATLKKNNPNESRHN